MRIYLKDNVLDVALDRMRWLFDEFENIVIGFSGGKDSTVTFELALIVAKEKNRLPLNVLFIDQEAEWEMVITYIRDVMTRKEVKPYWLQIPIRLFNATSTKTQWLICWEDGAEWMREKESFSIQTNKYGTDRFHKLFNEFIKKEFPNEKTCLLGGVRTEESPMRLVGLTASATYKHATYGKKVKDGSHYIFYPLYDWSYTDIWKFINDNECDYCAIYDYMYRYGVPLSNMRVSNVHHETAIYSLFFMQEIEPETWSKLSKRVPGVNTASVMGYDDYFVSKLPHMFRSWGEYRNYLLETIIEKKDQNKFKNKFLRMDTIYSDMVDINILHKAHVQTLLANDVYFTKLSGFEGSKPAVAYRKHKAGKSLDVIHGKVYDAYIKRHK